MPAKFQSAQPHHVEQCFATWQAQNPQPTTELKYGNPYQLLIAVVLSAQTTDKAVNAATAPFFTTIVSPALMVAWGESNLREAIRTLGLFRTKAHHVIALSQQLMANYNGGIPTTMNDLMTLPGVGLKTASVIMNTLYGEPVVAVDTHVFRLSHRLGLANGKTPQAVAQQLIQVIPQPYLKHAHHWLILHGRYVCTARQPQCETCAINAYCPKNTL